MRVRESGNSIAGESPHTREDAKHPTSGCRFRRTPARVAATRPEGEGGSRARTLKTAQEDIQRMLEREAEIPVYGFEREHTQIIRFHHHLNSLRNGDGVEARSSE